MRADAVCIVTGAGSGIGRATAIRLASDGASVVAADLNEEAARGTRSLGEGVKGELLPERLDVRRPEDVDSLVSRTVERFGRVDCMIANAGVLLLRPFIETSPDELDGVLAANFKGVYFCGQAAARAMIATGEGGQIINIVSTYAEVCDPDVSAYCSSKAAVRMLTKVMATELGPYAIRVNAIGPGLVQTPMTAEPYLTPDEITEIEESTPLGRLGMPEDIASAVAMMLSDDANWVTGTTLFVDGGAILNDPLGPSRRGDVTLPLTSVFVLLPG